MIVEAVETPSRSSQRSAHRESGADGGVDVDAHEAGRLGILRGGPHGFAQPGIVDKKVQSGHQRHGRADHDQLAQLEVNVVAQQIDVVFTQQVREKDRGPALPVAAQIHQDKRHADGRNQRNQTRLTT